MKYSYNMYIIYLNMLKSKSRVFYDENWKRIETVFVNKR